MGALQQPSANDIIISGVSAVAVRIKSEYNVDIMHYVKTDKLLREYKAGNTSLLGVYRLIIEMLEEDESFMAFHESKLDDPNFMKTVRMVYCDSVS